MSADRRLDDAVAALATARPRLDEITRARVGARVEAALARDAAAPVVVPRPRRVPLVLPLAGVGAAAAVVAVLWVRADDAAVRPEGAVGAADERVAGPVVVAAGGSRRVELDDTAVTVFGPGRLEPAPAGATADAAALVVDRPRGDAPWTLRYGPVAVVVTRATFALDRGAVVRVTVMRGEVELRCDDTLARPVRAGESAACALPPASTGAALGASASAAPVTVETRGEPAHTGSAPARPASTTGVSPARAPARAAITASEPPAATDRAPSALATAPAPPAPPAPGPAATAAAPTTAAADPTELVASAAAPDLYALAEGAMRRGDERGARAALQAVIAAAPASVDAALALLDLARLAHRSGDDAAARAHLDRLARHPHRSAVAAPADRLRAQLSPR